MSRLQTLTADLLIIGAGPAGLAAAETAIAQRRRVALVDQQAAPGGQIWRQGVRAAWPKARLRRFTPLFESAKLHWLGAHRLVLWLGPGHALLEGPQGALEVRATQLLLAAGAREFVPPFPGWTLPGVTGAGGLQAMAKGGVDLAGERVALVGTGPLLLASAASLVHAGVRLTGIFERQSSAKLRAFAANLLRHPGKLLEAVALRWRIGRAPFAPGWQLVAAEGVDRLQAVRLLGPDQREYRVACSRLGVGFGLVPNVEVAAGLDLKQRFDGAFPALQVDQEQRCSIASVLAAGEITGVGGGALAEVEGRIAALADGGDRAELRRWQQRRQRLRRFAELLGQSFPMSQSWLPAIDPSVVVCRCEDVAWAALQATAERDWRALKLATRLGMGACQGRGCGAILRAYGQPGQLSARPPISPVSAALLASLQELELLPTAAISENCDLKIPPNP